MLDENVEDNEDFAFLNATKNDEEVMKPDVCVERWKSASPEAWKKMYVLFAIAGGFVSVCWHGHVLLACNMIRSGELYIVFFNINSESRLTYVTYLEWSTLLPLLMLS